MSAAQPEPGAARTGASSQSSSDAVTAHAAGEIPADAYADAAERDAQAIDSDAFDALAVDAIGSPRIKSHAMTALGHGSAHGGRHRTSAADLNRDSIEQGPQCATAACEDEPLGAYCDSRRLDVPARLRLFVALCEAVEVDHQHGRRRGSQAPPGRDSLLFRLSRGLLSGHGLTFGMR